MTAQLCDVRTPHAPHTMVTGGWTCEGVPWADDVVDEIKEMNYQAMQLKRKVGSLPEAWYTFFLCGKCGAVVDETIAHTAWHKEGRT